MEEGIENKWNINSFNGFFNCNVVVISNFMVNSIWFSI